MIKLKKGIYLLLFFVSLILFVLQVFILEYPDGDVGMVVCMVLSATMVFTCVKLIQMSQTFKETLKKVINILFRISG